MTLLLWCNVTEDGVLLVLYDTGANFVPVRVGTRNPFDGSLGSDVSYCQ